VSNLTPTNGPACDVPLAGRKVCVLYDSFFPLTHGGAERWYRVLVERLVSAEANVTYLTRRQWPHEPPTLEGVEIIAVSGASELYDAEGARRTGPAVAFGAGSFSWMVRHRREFDAVIVANFPFFSLLAVRGALAGTGIPIFVDYHEVWSSQYWWSYAGRSVGTLGILIQRLCIGVTHFAQVFNGENARRLRQHGFQGEVALLAGLLPGSRMEGIVSTTPPDDPVVLFVGRHVKDKGVRLLPEILAAARVNLSTLKMVVISDGPERAAVESEMNRLGLAEAVLFTGQVSDEELHQYFAKSSCTIVPSLREGYGIVVAESVAAGTPVVVANNAENLATGLVDSGVNGFVVEPSAKGMANGIAAVVVAGGQLRSSAAEWYAQHSKSMSMDRSADEMVIRLSTCMPIRTPRWYKHRR
jgi:glycosyltransferase involved in cell wall biosynthesis